MTGSLFDILNTCYKLYLLSPQNGKSGYTDQNTGQFVSAVYDVSEIFGNVEQNTNLSRNLDIHEGSTFSGSITLICYYKLKIGSYVYYNGNMYEITDESTSTPFMARMVGEMRYTYNLNMTTTISPTDLEEYISTGRMNFLSYAFNFKSYDLL